MEFFIKKNKYQKLLRPFACLFLIGLIAWNWNSLSWAFNYEVLYEKLYVLLQGSRARVEQVVKGPVEEVSANPVQKFDYFDKQNSIEISKIGLDAPIVFIKDNNEKEFERGLKKGVTHYPDSVLPGEEGQTIFLGHSAPINWPDINYYKIFTRLNELEQGDEIFIYFGHRKYEYKMVKSVVIEKGGEIPDLTNSKSMVVLLTCWPPGKDYKRMAVIAEEI